VGCLVVLFSLITPRLVIVVMWIFTNYLSTAYGSWTWPTLGFFFLPTTTIAYAVAVNDLSSSSPGVTGTEISAAGVIVIVVGVLIDIGALGGGARARKG